MDLNYLSDYGTGSSSNSSPSSSWLSSGASSLLQLRPGEGDVRGHRAASFQDLVTGRCTLDDIMREFQMNGSDTPLDTFHDNIWSNQTEQLVGMGPSSAFVRQMSWPAPASSPAPRLPRAAPASSPAPRLPRAAPASSPAPRLPRAAPASSPAPRLPRARARPPHPPPPPPPPSANDFFAQTHEFHTSTPIDDGLLSGPAADTAPGAAGAAPTAEQWRVLNSLPNAVLFPLLQRLEQGRPRRYNECRFCKNNGERESYYRSHALKEAGGRVTCPVLRAFVCKRCGASGDAAHTSKYCPLSTADERMKSAAMMRSVRQASGRRRYSLPPAAADDYVMFGETTTSAILDNNIYNSYLVTPPLDPSWAALEQKLLL